MLVEEVTLEYNTAKWFSINRVRNRMKYAKFLIMFLFILLFQFLPGELRAGNTIKNRPFTLIISTNVPEVDIYIDNEWKGKTDDTKAASVSLIKGRAYHVLLKKEGYESKEGTIDMRKIEHDPAPPFTLKKEVPKDPEPKINNSYTNVDKKKSRESISTPPHDKSENNVQQDDFHLLLIVAGGFPLLILVISIFLRIDSNRRNRIGNFALKSVIGRGGFSIVYKARELKSKRIVALKFLKKEARGNPEIVDEFLDEGATIKSLNERIPHAPIVKIISCSNNPCPYIVMEFLPGSDLRAVIQQKTHMSLSRTVWIVKEITRGARALHELDIVHGDLKHKNIMLNHAQVTLIDFGSASKSRETENGGYKEIIGTPTFFSPEHCRGGGISAKSDIYSIGVIFYYLVTGHPPFYSQDRNELISMHLHSPVPDPGIGIPGNIKKLLYSLLDKNPEKRPTAAQLESYLEEILASGVE